MLAEPILSFLLVKSAQKFLSKTNASQKWLELSKWLLYGIVAFFIIEKIFHLEKVTIWIWHAFLIGLIIASLTVKELKSLRTFMWAFLPFVVLSFAANLTEAINKTTYKKFEDYFDVGIAFSIVWLIAMIISSTKQQKALQKANEKALAEEEQKKWMTIKKEELEKVVAERTSKLQEQKKEIENNLTELKATQSQLIHAEKMASLGELTAGIAHEIQNPLNFVNNFSELNSELIHEMNVALTAGDIEEVKMIANDINENEKKIIFHGKRASDIVKGMLQHSRASSSVKEPTDINALCDEYFRLAYHGLRAKDKSFNATMKTEYDPSLEKINAIPQDIGRVILNLITNAFYVVEEKKTNLINAAKMQGETAQVNYEPTVTVVTKKIHDEQGRDRAEIKIIDNGSGIPQKIIEKIFLPFFTTKPTGKGTGLGLSMSYDIVTKAHGGELTVTTQEGEGTEFTISLPI
ncbi:MAG: ATP-binding protein [Ginsengibacter sp.]